MAVGDTLRFAGAAGCEENDGGSIRRLLFKLSLGAGGIQQFLQYRLFTDAPVGVVVKADKSEGQPFDRFAPRKFARSLDMGEQERSVRDLQSIIDFRRGIPVVQRGRNKTGLEASQIVDQQRRTVRHKGGDTITLAKPELQVACSQSRRGLINFTPGSCRRQRNQGV